MNKFKGWVGLGFISVALGTYVQAASLLDSQGRDFLQTPFNWKLHEEFMVGEVLNNINDELTNNTSDISALDVRVTVNEGEIVDHDARITSNEVAIAADTDPDPTNELITSTVLNGSDLEIVEAGVTNTTDLSSLVGGAPQTLSIVTTNLSISGGNTVDLSGLIDDADSDISNELITSTVLNGTDLEIVEAGVTNSTDLASLVDDLDADPANELISAVTLVGTVIDVVEAGITNSAELSSLINDADFDVSNELIDSVSLVGTDLDVVEAGITNTADLSSLVDDADADPANELIDSTALVGTVLDIVEAGITNSTELSSLVDDADADPANELITATVLNVNTLEIVEAGTTNSTDLSQFLDNTDAQTLTFVTTNLSISGGNTVDLSGLIDDADADAANELITSTILNGTDLEIVEAGVTNTTDLSTLAAGDNLGNHAAASNLNMGVFNIDFSGDPSLNGFTTNETDTSINKPMGAFAVQQAIIDGGDNLGNHTMVSNLITAAFYISQDGTASGLFVEADGTLLASGDVTTSTSNTSSLGSFDVPWGNFHLAGDGLFFGVNEISVSGTNPVNVLYNGLSIAAAGNDDLGNHIATEDVQLGAFAIDFSGDPPLSGFTTNTADSDVDKAMSASAIQNLVQSGGDNLGNHTATTNLLMGAFDITFGGADQPLSGFTTNETLSGNARAMSATAIQTLISGVEGNLTIVSNDLDVVKITQTLQTLTFASPTTTWDANSGMVAKLTLTGDTAIADIANVNFGLGTLIVVQDVTGGHALTHGAGFTGSPTINTNASAVTWLQYINDNTTIYVNIESSFP